MDQISDRLQALRTNIEYLLRQPRLRLDLPTAIVGTVSIFTATLLMTIIATASTRMKNSMPRIVDGKIVGSNDLAVTDVTSRGDRGVREPFAALVDPTILGSPTIRDKIEFVQRIFNNSIARRSESLSTTTYVYIAIGVLLSVLVIQAVSGVVMKRMKYGGRAPPNLRAREWVFAALSSAAVVILARHNT